MTYPTVVLLLTSLALTGSHRSAVAQSLSETDLKTIQSSLADKTLVLKSYAVDSVVAYESVEGHMKPALVHKKGLGVFTLRDVRQKNGYLEIDGSQKLYVRTEGTQTLSPTHGDSPVALAIYMASVPDMAKLVSTLKEELFYDSLQEAFAAVPVDQQPCIPLVYSPAKRAILPAPQCRTPTAASAPAPPHLTKNGGDTEIPPRVRDEAGQGQWMVTVAFTVNERGVPEAVHVAKPAFLIPNFKLSELAAKDLDESAVTAVKKYRFRPAMQDGKPVSFPLYVEVDFQIIDR